MFRKPESARSMKFFREACYYLVLELNEKERNPAASRGEENSKGRFAELAIFQLKGQVYGFSEIERVIIIFYPLGRLTVSRLSPF